MNAPKKPPALDLDLIRELAGLLNETGLTEIEYGSGELHVRVAKAQAPIVPGVALSSGLTAAASGAAVAGIETDELAKHPGLLTSPMVGVVYTTAEPNAPPFVKVGDNVKVGDTLLLIEAMKVFNPIKAPRAGRISRILVSNGVPVEYGEPLLIIE